MGIRTSSLVIGIAVLLAAGGQLSAACSGGSGGSGYGYGSGGTTPTPDPTYTPTSSAFPSSTDPTTSAITSSRVLVILQPHRAPLGIWDESLATLSKTMPFVKYEDAEAARFADQWGIDSVPAVALCDRNGNVIASTSSPVTAQNIHHLLDHADDAQAELESSLGTIYQSAEHASTSHHIAKALEELAVIGHYKGLKICSQASTLQSALLQQGLGAITQAEGSGDPSHTRSLLNELRRTYRGTVVADEASRALRQLE